MGLLEPALDNGLETEFDVEPLGFAFDVELPASVLEVGLVLVVVEADAVPGSVLRVELIELVLAAAVAPPEFTGELLETVLEVELKPELDDVPPGAALEVLDPRFVLE